MKIRVDRQVNRDTRIKQCPKHFVQNYYQVCDIVRIGKLNQDNPLSKRIVEWGK